MEIEKLKNIFKEKSLPIDDILTTGNIVEINQLAYLYSLNSSEIEKCVLQAINEDNELDNEEFRKACREAFQVNELERNKNVTPKSNLSKERELIQIFENSSQQQILEDVTGRKALEDELKLINNVLEQQELQPAVMNVLIHYVLLSSNMQLSKLYLEKIAIHWKSQGLMNAKDAMEFARHQNNTSQIPRKVQGKTLYQKIVEAINKEYTDEQLGYYVRSIINR